MTGFYALAITQGCFRIFMYVVHTAAQAALIAVGREMLSQEDQNDLDMDYCEEEE